MSDRNVFILGLSPVVIALLATINPSILSAENSIVEEISSLGFLGYMGVILTLSIGLLVQLFFWVGALNDRLDKSAIREIRLEIRSTAKFLVSIFSGSTLIIIAKSFIVEDSLIWLALSGLQIWLVIFYTLILYDVVMSVFEFDV